MGKVLYSVQQAIPIAFKIFLRKVDPSGGLIDAPRLQGESWKPINDTS